MKSKDERRENYRVDVDYPAIILLKKYDFVDRGIRGIVKNLSIDGAFVDDVSSINIRDKDLEHLIEDKSEIRLEFYNRECRVSINGRIAWSYNTSDIPYTKYLGVSFTTMHRKPRMWLKKVTMANNY